MYVYCGVCSLSPVSRVTGVAGPEWGSGRLTINSGACGNCTVKSFALHWIPWSRARDLTRPRQLLYEVGIHTYVCTYVGTFMYIWLFLAPVSVFVDFAHPNLFIAFRRLPPFCASNAYPLLLDGHAGGLRPGNRQCRQARRW